MFNGIGFSHLPRLESARASNENIKRTNPQGDSLASRVALTVRLCLKDISVMARAMKDWPDPDENSGSGLLIHLEFWGVAALMVLGFVLGYGPALIRWFER